MRSKSTGRTSRLPFRLLVAAGLALLLAACGSSTTLHPGYPVVTVTGTNSGLKFASYVVSVDQITLTEQNGAIVSLLSVAQQVDLAKAASISELVSAYSVPYGTYVSASLLLDYTAASMSVNVNGAPVAASFAGVGNTALSTVSVVVTFDPAKPLVVTLNEATPVHFNFDLQAFNTIISGTIPAVIVEPYVTLSPAPLDQTPVRARGSFVVQQDGGFIMNLRPFYNFSALLGAVLVYPTADAYYNINGVIYRGPAGLAAMTNLPEATVTVAYGTVTGLSGPDSTTATNPTMSATEIYAGTSQENGLSYVAGMVSARSGDTLTLRGVTLNYYSGTQLFTAGAVVTIDSGLPVAMDGVVVSGLNSQSLSVGQAVYISGSVPLQSSGSLTYDTAGNLVFDATTSGGGTARLTHTRLWGDLVSATPTAGTFDLLSLGIYSPVGYNFAGTGSGAPANPAAYQVDTGTTALDSGAAGSLFAIDGDVTAFGTAPPDFTATSIVPGSQTEQTLAVVWPLGEVAPFSSASSAGYVVDLSKASIGTVDDIFTGPVGMDLKTLPASPLITTTGADQTALVLSVGSAATATTGISVFATPGAYYTGVHAALNGTNKIHYLVAAGHYNSVTNTFVAERISMALL
jgi:hypothetical protein